MLQVFNMECSNLITVENNFKSPWLLKRRRPQLLYTNAAFYFKMHIPTWNWIHAACSNSILLNHELLKVVRFAFPESRPAYLLKNVKLKFWRKVTCTFWHFALPLSYDHHLLLKSLIFAIVDKYISNYQ